MYYFHAVSLKNPISSLSVSWNENLDQRLRTGPRSSSGELMALVSLYLVPLHKRFYSVISPKQLFSYMHACRNQEHWLHSPGGTSVNFFLLRSLAWDTHWEVPGEVTGIDGNKTLGVLWNFPEDLTSVWCEKAFLACKMCVSEELLSCQHTRWLGAGRGLGKAGLKAALLKLHPASSFFPGSDSPSIEAWIGVVFPKAVTVRGTIWFGFLWLTPRNRNPSGKKS